MDDLLGDEDTGRPDTNNRRNKARKSLGPLHDLLTERLPDLRHPAYGVCDLHELAKLRGMSFQGVYKWFRPNHPNKLPVGQVDFLVDLSARQKDVGDDFVPLSRDDLWPFVNPT
jgi:hypothetical protein